VVNLKYQCDTNIRIINSRQKAGYLYRKMKGFSKATLFSTNWWNHYLSHSTNHAGL